MSWISACLLFALIALGNSEETYENILKSSLGHFSSGLHKHTVAKNEGKNIVMSPMSAQIALAMLSMGAEGQTFKELRSAMNLANKDEIKAAFKLLMDHKEVAKPSGRHWHSDDYNPKPPTFRIVNKVYVKNAPGYNLTKEYRSVVVDSFKSEVQNVDFAASDYTTKLINSWVEEKTNKKIKDFLQTNQLDRETRMMLVNAVFYKGAWEVPFEPRFTRKDTFNVNETETVEVDFMNIMADLETATLSEYDAWVVRLRFYGSDQSMLFVVPNHVNGLSSVEEKITSVDLKDIMSRLRSYDVRLAIPKFKIASDINLKEILPKMGISEMFKKSAEFYGMIESRESLYVTDARQRAFIEIDEYGCEAAAATRIPITGRSLPGLLQMNVPFYYALIDGVGNRMFSGRVVNPAL